MKCLCLLFVRYQFSHAGTEANLLKLTAEQLEAKHRENEEKRGQINQLKEEQIHTMLKLCDNHKELPSRNGLQPLSVIDTAGVGDAEDKKGVFWRW